MGRIIGSVIAGYLAMFVLVFVLFSLAYTVLGASGAFQPGSWDVAGSWVALTIVIGLAAAVVGGYICAAIARDRRGPLWLVALVIVLGLLFAIPVLTGGAPAAAGPRPDAVPMFEAMSKAVQPIWVALLKPTARGGWCAHRGAAQGARLGLTAHRRARTADRLACRDTCRS